jgi:hypothetical protein
MATMPMLKICTPPPDMYSMNACMGKDFMGEMAKSHAFLVFRPSYEFTTAASFAPALAVIAAAEDEDLLDAFPYKQKERYVITSIHNPFISVGSGRAKLFGTILSPSFPRALC